jgi:hypothetical protein
MKKFYLAIGVLFFAFISIAGADGFELKEFVGVVKSLNGKPVRAKIEFYNLGGHDHLGNLHSDSITGGFKVKFKNNVSYSIFISAHGYFSNYMIVNIHDSVAVHEFVMIPIAENIILPLDHILFDEGQHIINDESFAELDNLVGFLKINPEVIIQIEGHTDYMGSKSANQDLASRRIEEVKKYILLHGVKKKRIHTKSFGGTMPLVISSNAEERKVNRRVEVRIIQIKH